MSTRCADKAHKQIVMGHAVKELWLDAHIREGFEGFKIVLARLFGKVLGYHTLVPSGDERRLEGLEHFAEDARVIGILFGKLDHCCSVMWQRG